jgi:hypothetical protein
VASGKDRYAFCSLLEVERWNVILLPLKMRYKIPHQFRETKGVFLLGAGAIALVLLGIFIGKGSLPSFFNAEDMRTQLVTTETARWEWVYRQLRADKRFVLHQLRLPASALRYRSTPSGVSPEETIYAKGRYFPVVAVPRIIERYLQKNGVTYLDPKALPGTYFASMSEKTKQTYLQDYLWVPDVSPHQGRFFRQ